MRPGSPGSSGKAHRTGWVTENTHRPPGRSTRATSAMTRSGSATKGTAPYALNARSNAPSGERQRPSVGLDEPGRPATSRGVRPRRRGHPGPEPARLGEHPGRQVERRDVGAVGGDPACALRGAAPDLEDPPPREVGGVAEQVRVDLAQPLGAPDEVVVAEEVAVLVEVLPARAVPPAPVRPDRLRGSGRPVARDGRARGSDVVHGAILGPLGTGPQPGSRGRSLVEPLIPAPSFRPRDLRFSASRTPRGTLTRPATSG